MQGQPQRTIFKVIITGMLVLTFGSFNLKAQTVDDETPAFANPAQAQKAENISAATAKEPSEEDIAVLEDSEQKALDLEKAEAVLVEAQEKLGLLPDDAPPEDIEAAKKAVEDAQKAYDAAEAEYDAAKALADKTMAELAGVPVSEVYELRQTMGWGQICHYYGIPNNTVGIGRQKQKGFNHRHRHRVRPVDEETMTEVQAMTQRNLKTGWAKGHDFAGNETVTGKENKSKGEKAKSHANKKPSHASISSHGGKGVGKSNKGSKSSNSSGSRSGEKSNNGNKGGNKGDKSNNGNKGGNSGGKGKK